MTITYKIHKELNLVHTTAKGTLTADEWIAYNKELASNPNFHPDFNQFADFTQVTDIRISPDRRMEVAQAAPFSKGSKRAVVVSSDYIYGMARVYEAYSKPHTILKIFRNKKEAEEWLNL